MQIVPFPLEEGMLFHMQHNVEITRRAALHPAFTHSRIADTRSVFHPGRNFRFHRSLFQNPRLPLCIWAWIRNHLTPPPGMSDTCARC